MTSVQHRKSLGAFYTPRWLAEVLVGWALESNCGPVLDPSFGGCAFLQASLDCLRHSGVPHAERYVFGLDIDPNAQQFALPLRAAGIPASNLILGDFLTPRSCVDLPPLAAVVGNPPYIRHHLIHDDGIAMAQNLIVQAGASLQKTASAWAYFTIMAAASVRRSGRLALILPGTLLHAKYAKDVIVYLQACFGSVRLLHVHDRLFEDTHEESVLLLAAGKGKTSKAQYRRIRGRSDLLEAIRNRSEDRDLIQDLNYKLALLPAEIVEAWKEIKDRQRFTPLGEACRIRIGVVTGANNFFIRHSSDPLLTSAYVDSYPLIYGRANFLGPACDKRLLRKIDLSGAPTRLLCIRARGRKGSRLENELRSAEAAGISARHHCQKRRPWYRITDRDIPDLFLPYMGSTAPNLSYNLAAATCTNAVHRLWFNERYRGVEASAVASSFTSLFAFEAELFGRHYGGGILKVEPTAASNLTVLFEGAEAIYSRLVELAAQGNRFSREYVDYALLQRVLKVSARCVVAIQEGLHILVKQRERLREKTVPAGTQKGGP